jgi:tetratricopeptide (TPR) repeat protein
VGRLAAGCFEVLLTWAEAEAGTPAPAGLAGDAPGHPARKALRLLEAADTLAQEIQFPIPKAFYPLRADCWEQVGDGARAAGERGRAPRDRPTTALGHFLHARDLYQEGKTAPAAAACAEALALDPDCSVALYLRALCRLEDKDPHEARFRLSLYLNRWPGSFGGHLLRGIALDALGLFDDAESDFDRALRAAGDDRFSRSAVLTNRGAMRFHARRPGEAEKDLDEAIRLWPWGYQAYQTLATLHLEGKEWARAAAAAEAALCLQPPPDDLAALHRARGRARVKLHSGAACSTTLRTSRPPCTTSTRRSRPTRRIPRPTCTGPGPW